MRKTILPIFMIVFMTTALFAAAQEEAGPRISVKELRYDLGPVQQGKQVSHVFEFTNSGTGTLVIERLQPG